MAPQTPAPQPSQSKSSFAAVADASTRVLILGSLPGEASLRRAQYYAHPQNQFWRLAGAVINADLAAAAYPDRLQILLRAGIGLWDVISSAERRGSLDADIRNHQPNALAAFAATLPSASRGTPAQASTSGSRSSLGVVPGLRRGMPGANWGGGEEGRAQAVG